MARPRDPDIDRRILEAARLCLAEDGYQHTTMDAIARRAGVGKPAVYLRWSNKTHLVFELTIGSVTSETLPDTGSIVTDLLIVLERLEASVEAVPRVVMGDRIGAMITDHAFFADVWERQAGPVAREVFSLWEKAVERGEVDPEAPGWRICNDLSYVVICRHLIFHDPLGRSNLEELVHRNVDGALLK